jgi:hypothetical protein
METAVATSISTHPDRLRHPYAASRGHAQSARSGGFGLRAGSRSRAEESLGHVQEPPPAGSAHERRRADPTFEHARHLWLEEELFFRVVRDAIDETDFMDAETIELEPRGEPGGRPLRVVRREP